MIEMGENSKVHSCLQKKTFEALFQNDYSDSN